jgi:hypothetical protein
MTARERFLVRLLAGLALGAALFLGGGVAAGAVGGLQSNLARARKQHDALVRTSLESTPSADNPAELAREKAELLKRFPATDAVSIYARAERLRGELAALRLEADQLSVEPDRREIGLQLHGSLTGMLELVRRLQEGGRAVAIVSLRIQAAREGGNRMDIRVKYVENPL